MCIGLRHTRRCVRAKASLLPLATQPSPTGTGTDGSGTTYTTANESVDGGVEPVESQAARVVGGERDWLGELREDVERHLAQKPSLRVNIKVGRGTASCAEYPSIINYLNYRLSKAPFCFQKDSV